MPTSAAKTKADLLPETFAALKKIYKPFEKRCHVVTDTETTYYLESKAPVFRGKPICVGMVRMGKGRVAFHMMALYCFADMKKQLSPELKKRMQGKQCFNFSKPDAALFAELSKLAGEGMKRFAEIKDFEAHFRGKSCDD